MIANRTDAPTVLDGFTIRGASAQSSIAIAAALLADAARLTVSNCSLKDNGDVGLLAKNWSTIRLNRSTFTENLVQGAIGDRSNLVATDCSFIRNGRGFGVSDGTVTLTHCAFEDNERLGAGLSGTGSITGCTFQNNKQAGLSMYGRYVVTNSTFKRNHVGGLRAGSSTVTVNGCQFVRNLSWGLYASGSFVRVFNSRFLDNTGDGAYSEVATLHLTNTLLSGNHGGEGGAYSAVRLDWSNGLLTNCTITENHGAYGVDFYRSDTVITNSILWANSQPWDASELAQIHLVWSAESTVAVDHSIVEGWTGTLGGVGNSGNDPLLLDADGPDNVPGTEDDNPRLLPGSPALDAGDSGALPADSADLDGDGNTAEPIPVDLGGRPRISGDSVDIGAFEGPSQAIFTSGDTVFVPEGGAANFTATLAMDPLGPIEVAVRWLSGDKDIAVQSAPKLLFTSDDFFIPQTVTLAAQPDAGFTNDRAIIELSAAGMDPVWVHAIEADDAAVPPRVYVNPAATGLATGMNWLDAFTDLQETLAVAQDRPGIEEIWVARGTYTPTQPGGDQYASFELQSGLALYGGFKGGEVSLDQRDFSKGRTVLSGDLNRDDGLDFHNYLENAYSVVTADEADSTALLDGFVITGGTSSGMYFLYGGPTIRNCVLERNRAYTGGAVDMFDANPTFENCTFLGNVSRYSGGAVLGNGGPTRLRNCLFSGNVAGQWGGAVSAGSLGLFDISNCTFVGNKSKFEGGGADLGYSSRIRNSVFWDNKNDDVDDFVVFHSK